MARSKLKQYVSPRGIAMYPWLNKPDTEYDSGTYKVTLKLTDEDFTAPNKRWDGQSLKEVLEAAVEAKFQESVDNAKTPAIAKKITKTMPFHAEEDDDGEPTGNWKLTFKMKAHVEPKNGEPFDQKPIIVDSKQNEMNEAIYGGSEIKVQFQVVPYYMAKDKAAGVSLRLSAVQVLELVQGTRGTAFEDEDGYESSSGSSGTAFDDDDDEVDDDEDDGSDDF